MPPSYVHGFNSLMVAVSQSRRLLSRMPGVFLWMASITSCSQFLTVANVSISMDAITRENDSTVIPRSAKQVQLMFTVRVRIAVARRCDTLSLASAHAQMLIHTWSDTD